MPHFSSTNAEGLGRGLGAFANGVGQMNLYNSMAAVNFQEARRRSIENRLAATEAYFEMRRVNEEYREVQARRRGNLISTGQVASSTARREPAPIVTRSGSIQWPKPLQGRAYLAFRDQLESQFARGTDMTPRASEAARRRVQEATSAMKDELKARMNEMTSGEYIAAKKFIDGLATEYELRLDTKTEHLAAR